MHTRFRIGAVVLLIAAVGLWAGCDSGGTLSANPPSVQFASDIAATAPADSIFDIEVTLTDSVGVPVSVEVLYANPASSTWYSDLGGYDSTSTIARSVEFPAGAAAGATEAVELDVSDADISNGPKEAFFALQNLNTEGSAEIGSPREFTLNVGYPSVQQVRDQGVGASVIYRAIVTEVSESDVFMQDETAGMYVAGNDNFASAVEPGHQVVITGTLSTFGNLLEIYADDLASYEIVSTGNEIPDPVTTTLGDIQENPDEHESELVRVEGLTIDPGGDETFQAGGAAGNYTVTDEEGTELTLRLPGASYYAGEPIPEGPITFEGVLGAYFTGPQLRARYEGAIIPE